MVEATFYEQIDKHPVAYAIMLTVPQIGSVVRIRYDDGKVYSERRFKVTSVEHDAVDIRSTEYIEMERERMTVYGYFIA